jgi:predicted acetyltransferase
MLHMMPYTLVLNGHRLRASYIYRVGTDPKHRGNGLARVLLEQALFEMHLRDVAAALLIPQQGWLVDFYRKSGFEPVFSLVKKSVANVPGGGRPEGLRAAGTEDIPAINALYERKMRG